MSPRQVSALLKYAESGGGASLRSATWAPTTPKINVSGDRNLRIC